VTAAVNFRVPYSFTILHFIIYHYFAVQNNRMNFLCTSFACPAEELINFNIPLGLCMIVNL
jgi:hypothetical protein